LNRTLVHACYAEARRARAWNSHIRVLSIEPTEPDTSRALADRDQLERGFRRLPPEQRAILVLRHYLGLEPAEIAETLGIKDGDMDLLYPNTTYVHASHFTDEEWALVRDSGGNVSFAPQIEVQMGHGWAPAVTALEYNIPIGPSSDVATTASADQFTQMHAIFASERARRHEVAWDDGLEWNEPESKLITARQVLEWATLGGAKVAGLADRTGSIMPGKKADIVIIDASAVNVAPIIDPVGAVVLRGGRFQREDSPRRRRDPQAGLPARGLARRAAEAGRGVARSPDLEVRRARGGLADGIGAGGRRGRLTLARSSGTSPATFRAASGGRSYPQGRPPEVVPATLGRSHLPDISPGNAWHGESGQNGSFRGQISAAVICGHGIGRISADRLPFITGTDIRQVIVR
jgi:Amidohydrolase family/Sigma-70, region 4